MTEAEKRTEVIRHELGQALDNLRPDESAGQGMACYHIENALQRIDPSIYSRMDKLEAENAALRKALKDAPHRDSCASHFHEAICNVCLEDHSIDGRAVCEGFTHWVERPCDCFKSRIQEAH